MTGARSLQVDFHSLAQVRQCRTQRAKRQAFLDTVLPRRGPSVPFLIFAVLGTHRSSLASNQGVGVTCPNGIAEHPAPIAKRAPLLISLLRTLWRLSYQRLSYYNGIGDNLAVFTNLNHSPYSDTIRRPCDTHRFFSQLGIVISLLFLNESVAALSDKDTIR